MDASDQLLLHDFLSGKEQAFRQLSERHMNLVYGVAMRNTSDPSIAEEVVQDVFILLARKARKLASHPCVAGWLHLTSRNVARDAWSKRMGHQKKLRRFAEASPPISDADSPPAMEGHLAEIDTAVSALPDPEREAILLRFFEDKDYREIAGQLGISEPAARKRVSRGIQRLHSGLATKLAAGTALAIVAPAYLSKAVAGSIFTAAPLSAATAATAGTIVMTKSTITIGCAALAVATLGFISVQQYLKNEDLTNELSQANTELSGLRSKLGDGDGNRRSRSKLAQPDVDQKARIEELEAQLLAEETKRKLAEADAEAVRKATDGLEDQVVLAFGKIGEIGTDFGDIFKEAIALADINSWLTERQEFYRGVREQLRAEIPADRIEQFDRFVEQDGIGFTNVRLKGSPLGFSLGGRQD